MVFIDPSAHFLLIGGRIGRPDDGEPHVGTLGNHARHRLKEKIYSLFWR